MMCQECQERQATLHFKKVIQGEKTEIHLCEQCAQGKGDGLLGGDHFSVHHLFSDLFHSEGSNQAERRQFQTKTACRQCGMSYDQFRNVGRFGCARCYEAFADKLPAVFKRVQTGNERHQGKIPRRIGKSLQIEREITGLRTHLASLVAREEFEEAARVRDEIKQLTLQMEQAREEESS
ncbi:UvrB/UvrC motif-containing protein [Shouchella lonarensis]|uniref:Protein arginine kinase activator n=1 Tax=Shouchella lonarensis TaxID=1464122 RepID=A0A1G6LYM1_9BACI|nr:UvrB/UvrC motif-containing protein [Shouchella lonarensis]SDC47825.1 protein arginine kinase activator [Shouchella lonarensis]